MTISFLPVLQNIEDQLLEKQEEIENLNSIKIYNLGDNGNVMIGDNQILDDNIIPTEIYDNLDISIINYLRDQCLDVNGEIWKIQNDKMLIRCELEDYINTIYGLMQLQYFSFWVKINEIGEFE